MNLRLELGELLALLSAQSFKPHLEDGRPITNHWSPKYLGGRPGSESP
jgi:hypothetical protein